MAGFIKGEGGLQDAEIKEMVEFKEEGVLVERRIDEVEGRS